MRKSEVALLMAEKISEARANEILCTGLVMLIFKFVITISTWCSVNKICVKYSNCFTDSLTQ